MTNTDDQISALEEQQENLDTDDLDGCDIISVLMIVADSEDLDLLGFLDTQLAGDLISATQSNPSRSNMILREWAELDRKISDLQD